MWIDFFKNETIFFFFYSERNVRSKNVIVPATNQTGGAYFSKKIYYYLYIINRTNFFPPNSLRTVRNLIIFNWKTNEMPTDTEDFSAHSPKQTPRNIYIYIPYNFIAVNTIRFRRKYYHRDHNPHNNIRWLCLNIYARGEQI